MTDKELWDLRLSLAKEILTLSKSSTSLTT